MKDCRDCRFLEPFDEFVKTPMCEAKVPRRFTDLQRLPTGDCKPEAILWEAKNV